jgi:hypothetical protein
VAKTLVHVALATIVFTLSGGGESNIARSLECAGKEFNQGSAAARNTLL